MSRLVKKLTARTLAGDIKKIVSTIAEDGGRIALYRIWGIARGVQTGEHTSFGPWIAFTGQFGAVNLVTGEESLGSKAFLPEPVPGYVRALLELHDTVEFAIEVAVVRRDALAIGYEYEPSFLIENREADPLAHLKMLALPALAVDAEEPDSEVVLAPKSKKTKVA